ncbi:MAG: class I SAM-dependent methyltransferase [Armatimonadota bacterium]
MGAVIPRASSITHQHILSVVNTEICDVAGGETIRILDAGCGNGKLVAYLTRALDVLRPEVKWEVYGFDVHDHGVQAQGYIQQTLDFLNSDAPEIEWESRIASVGTTEPWPYPDGFFDVVVSNQVLEHVRDHARFFYENARVLRNGGFAVHLFPLGHYLYETHLNLPFVHWIGDHDLLYRYIRLLSRVGLGKYRRARRSTGISLDEYSERHADYIWHYTSYLSQAEAVRLARFAGLRAAYRYTPCFYSAKLRSLLRLSPRYVYRRRRSGILNWVGTRILRHVSCITLFLEKKETYRGQ